jgi:IS30 family transposase
MIDVSETMAGVRFMLEKYKWMAATKDHPLPKNVQDLKCRAPMTVGEILEIKRLHQSGMRVSHIAKQVNRSFSTVIRVIRGRSYKDIAAEREVKLEEWKASYRLDNGRSPTDNRINEMRKAIHADVINRYK